jgi:hypothetical protein
MESFLAVLSLPEGEVQAVNSDIKTTGTHIKWKRKAAINIKRNKRKNL